MEWMTFVLLFAAGTAGGLVNAVAGGATLITFPAMLYAGLPPVIANASNAVAIMPGHLLAALADRGQLPPIDRRTRTLLVTSVIGGAVGAFLLMNLPEQAFTKPIPALIMFATFLFGFAPRIQAWISGRPHLGLSSGFATPIVLSLTAVYGGFFGAGLGVILTAVLSITESGQLRSIKALKNLLATSVSLAATLVFILQGSVKWSETAVMLCGAMAGGFAGGGLIRVLPARWVRAFVIAAGIVMSGIYVDRYWF